MDRLYFLDHGRISAVFNKNSDDFVVEEKPLYEFSQDGEHAVYKIRKKDLTTWELISVISKKIGVREKDIGYAGLKDKHGLTIQYISFLSRYEDKLSDFSHPKIKILEKHKHKNKLKVGHLRANRFFVRLKKVGRVDAQKIQSVVSIIKKSGIPNYFGFQRFGNDNNNYETGKEILYKKTRIKDRKKEKFFINAYQSHLFNLWLSRRVEICKMFDSFDAHEISDILNLPPTLTKQIKKQKQFFKILPGDIASHYPMGKAFIVDDASSESERFMKQDIAPTGLLCGDRAIKAEGLASTIEKNFIDDELLSSKIANGSRRYAWIFVEDLECEYIEQKAWCHINFTLPKGSYATTFLEELLHRRIDIEY